jgi:maleylacetate reductase
LAADDPARALWEFTGRLGAPRSLRELGMAEADIDRVAAQVIATPYANPRPVTIEAATSLLHAAWSGRTPGR